MVRITSSQGFLRRHIYKHFYFRDFAALFIIWGILNTINGVMIFNHEILTVLDTTAGDLEYYYIVGFIRFAAGLMAIIIGTYLWAWSPELMALLRLMWRLLFQYEKNEI